MKIVIVGGVAGGASAAARLRRLDEKAQIVLFEKSGYISYANCGLPYYVGGVIQEESALTLQTPQSFGTRFREDVRIRHEVTAIHPERKTVTVRALDTGDVFEESYDKLVLSPGARPVVPNLPGIDGDHIYTLRNVEDTLRIRRFVEENQPESAVVIGGGFIGLEMAENLAGLGVDVTLVEKMDQVLSPFDADMASFIHARFKAAGVRLMLGRAVTGFEQTESGVKTHLDDGEPLESGWYCWQSV